MDRRSFGAHLVGSVPLKDSRAVFTLVGSELSNHLTRIPDGETGHRSNWIKWQQPVLANCPALEVHTVTQVENARPQIRLRNGFAAAGVKLGSLGYSRAAIASYQEFAKLKQVKALPKNCRFQVSLPTPLAPIQFFVAPEYRADLEPVYEARLLEELKEITDTIPGEELAIQWDTAVEFGILEGVFASHLEDPYPNILDRLTRLGNAVPDPVELGYHLCYGDSGHKHFVEPHDATHLTAVANGIVDGVDRSVNWIHLPIPRERTDGAFYEPLASLKLSPQTELYLGLIHMTDGEAGARRRIEAASAHVTKFGVATECGFGRRSAETIPELLQIHSSVVNAVGSNPT